MEHAPLRTVAPRPQGAPSSAEAVAYIRDQLPALDEPAAAALALVALVGRTRTELGPSAGTEALDGLSGEALADALARARKALRRRLHPLPGSGWCERAERLISDRLDDALEDPGPARLDVHLANCGRCVEHERRLGQAHEALVTGFAEARAPGQPRGEETSAPAGSASDSEATVIPALRVVDATALPARESEPEPLPPPAESDSGPQALPAPAAAEALPEPATASEPLPAPDLPERPERLPAPAPAAESERLAAPDPEPPFPPAAPDPSGAPPPATPPARAVASAFRTPAAVMAPRAPAGAQPPPRRNPLPAGQRPDESPPPSSPAEPSSQALSPGVSPPASSTPSAWAPSAPARAPWGATAERPALAARAALESEDEWTSLAPLLAVLGAAIAVLSIAGLLVLSG